MCGFLTGHGDATAPGSHSMSLSCLTVTSTLLGAQDMWQLAAVRSIWNSYQVVLAGGHCAHQHGSGAKVDALKALETPA